jgi:hypothetical protein
MSVHARRLLKEASQRGTMIRIAEDAYRGIRSMANEEFD